MIVGGDSRAPSNDCALCRSWLKISSCRLDGSSSWRPPSWARDWTGLRVGAMGGERERDDSVLW